MSAEELITNMINRYKNTRDFMYIQFVLKLMYGLKLTKEENDIILDNMYNDSRVNKITMLSQLKLFTKKHADFEYDVQKYDEYANHWNNLKEKHIEMRKKVLEEEKQKETIKLETMINESKRKIKKY